MFKMTKQIKSMKSSSSQNQVIKLSNEGLNSMLKLFVDRNGNIQATS